MTFESGLIKKHVQRYQPNSCRSLRCVKTQPRPHGKGSRRKCPQQHKGWLHCSHCLTQTLSLSALSGCNHPHALPAAGGSGQDCLPASGIFPWQPQELSASKTKWAGRGKLWCTETVMAQQVVQQPRKRGIQTLPNTPSGMLLTSKPSREGSAVGIQSS